MVNGFLSRFAPISFHEVREFAKDLGSSHPLSMNFFKSLRVAFALQEGRVRFQAQSCRKAKGTRDKNRTRAMVNIAVQLTYDELESRIRTAEAELGTAKARGETAKAQIKIEVIAALLMKQLIIVKKLREVKNSRKGV